MVGRQPESYAERYAAAKSRQLVKYPPLHSLISRTGEFWALRGLGVEIPRLGSAQAPSASS
jgi:hypothetical protein